MPSVATQLATTQPAATQPATPQTATQPVTTHPASPAVPAAPAAAGPGHVHHAVIEHVAAAHLGELSKCDNENWRGDVTVKFIVDADGKVTKSQLASAVKKHKLAACILRSVQKWQFPRQGPAGAQGRYTVSFQ